MKLLSINTQIMLLEAAKRGRNELKLIVRMYPSMPDGGALGELERVIDKVESEMEIYNEAP